MQKTQVLFMTLVSTLCLCTVMARSISHRTKRTSSDQRVAELQALLALAENSEIGHGAYRIDEIGKRKRADDSYMMNTDDDAALYDDLDRISKLRMVVEALQEYS